MKRPSAGMESLLFELLISGAGMGPTCPAATSSNDVT
jgi:hypothetical protein